MMQVDELPPALEMDEGTQELTVPQDDLDLELAVPPPPPDKLIEGDQVSLDIVRHLVKGMKTQGEVLDLNDNQTQIEAAETQKLEFTQEKPSEILDAVNINVVMQEAEEVPF